MRNNKGKPRVAHNKVDLTGKVFGKLTVIEDTGLRKSRRPIWKCKCECGSETNVLGKYLTNGDTKSCSFSCYSTGKAHNRTGFKELGGSYWARIKYQAKRRGIPLELTPEQAYNQLVKQGWKCAFTGETLKFAPNVRDCEREQTASLDRIDNSKGYSLDNVQWVHKVINVMRNTLSVDDFVNWAGRVKIPNKN